VQVRDNNYLLHMTKILKPKNLFLWENILAYNISEEKTLFCSEVILNFLETFLSLCTIQIIIPTSYTEVCFGATELTLCLCEYNGSRRGQVLNVNLFHSYSEYSSSICSVTEK